MRSRVTGAGCARSATRLPSSGRISSGSARSRSIPNEVMRACLRKVCGEASGVVEVGPVPFWMRERPVGLGAVLLFEDRRETHFEHGFRIHRNGRTERPPSHIVLDPDIRTSDVGLRAALAMARKIIGCPGGGWGEIPLAV